MSAIPEETIAQAKAFVFRKWCERAEERGMPAPEDLSSSCKFSTMFMSKLFGLKMRGNEDHQFCIDRDGEIVDLSADAADVQALANPHRHDALFWGSRDHRASMKSCEPRVDLWVREFQMEIALLHEEGPAP